VVEYERVRAFATPNLIACTTADDGVRAATAIDGVTTRASVDPVVGGIAGDGIGDGLRKLNTKSALVSPNCVPLPIVTFTPRSAFT
jgi:hypothetical protein